MKLRWPVLGVCTAWLLGALQCLSAATPSLAQVLARERERPALAAVLANPKRFELQIRWTRISKTAAEEHVSTQHFGVPPGQWFAAASLVKLPLAIMALEQLAQRDLPRTVRISSDMPAGCLPVPARVEQPPAAEAVQRSIHRLLVVSDNEAFNRLYQWLGPPLPQQRFRAMGFDHAHITRPLMVCDDSGRAQLGAWVLSDAEGLELAAQPGRAAQDRPHYAGAPVLRGKAWMENGVRIAGAHDFSDSNFLPLALLERELMAVVRPDLLSPEQRSSMREADRLWLRQTLGSTPPDSADPKYPAADYPAHYAKSLLVGDGRAWPEGVRIYNKVGESYGYLSDVAYIEDRRHNLAFFLSVVLSVDTDGTLNDGIYAYEQIGRPFLAELGEVILQAERRLHADGKSSSSNR